jgi:hypothetical protein
MALKEKKTFNLGDGLLLKFNPASDNVIFKFGRHESKVKRTDLWMMVFSMMDQDMQDKMIPEKKTEMERFVRTHNIKIIKDLKAGDIVKFHCEIDVPAVVAEGMKNLQDGDIQAHPKTLQPA